MQEQRSETIEWDRAAEYYDAFVRTELDLPFFRKWTQQEGGRALELMCGTGRLLVPLVQEGVDITGVDRSVQMLAQLRRKLTERGLVAPLHAGDVCELELGQQYSIVFNAFHAFAEILGARQRRRAFEAIRRHVAPGGALILTLHNPPVRTARVQAEEQSDGPFALPGKSTTLFVRSRWELDKAQSRLCGVQRYEERTSAGQVVREVLLPIQFDLVEREEVMSAAQACELRLEQFFGDYEERAFEAATSPFQIFVFRAPK